MDLDEGGLTDSDFERIRAAIRRRIVDAFEDVALDDGATAGERNLAANYFFEVAAELREQVISSLGSGVGAVMLLAELRERETVVRLALVRDLVSTLKAELGLGIAATRPLSAAFPHSSDRRGRSQVAPLPLHRRGVPRRRH